MPRAKQTSTKRAPRKERHSAGEAALVAVSDPGSAGMGLPEAMRPITPPPPPALRGPTEPMALGVEMQRSYFTNAAQMAASSAMAYQLDPAYQIMMRRDADIEASGQALWLAVACADWSLECDDKDDPAQAECADWLTNVYRQIPNLTDMRRQEMLAEWYGTSGVNFVIDAHPELRWFVKKWVPIQGDSIAFDIYGNSGFRVGAKYTSQISCVEMGFNSWVHLFTPEERKSVIIHSVFREAPFFDDSRSADQMFRGTGNRDRVWYYWFLKQEIMQQAAVWCKRYAAGIRKGRYPSGNEEAKLALLNALSNLLNDNNVALPREPGMEVDATDFEILEAPASRATMFIDLINWLSDKVKEVRQGQSLSSGTAGTGMGSGVADLHADTKSIILKYHANAVAESETTQMCWPLAEMRGFHPEVYRRVRMRIAIEKPNIAERMAAAQSFIDIGGTLDMDEVRAVTGFSKPAPGAEVLERQQPDPFAGILGADKRSEKAA